MTRSDSGPRREHVSLVVGFGRLDLGLARLLGRSTPRALIAKIAGFRFQALVRNSILSSGRVSVATCIFRLLGGRSSFIIPPTQRSAAAEMPLGDGDDHKGGNATTAAVAPHITVADVKGHSIMIHA